MGGALAVGTPLVQACHSGPQPIKMASESINPAFIVAAGRTLQLHRLSLLFADSLAKEVNLDSPSAVPALLQRWRALPEGDRASWRQMAGVETFEGMPSLLHDGEAEEGPPPRLDPFVLPLIQRPTTPFAMFTTVMRRSIQHQGRMLYFTARGDSARLESVFGGLPARARLEWHLLAAQDFIA